MKKIITLIVFLLLLCSCSKPEEVKYTYEVNAVDVDMSVYNDLTSTDHCFKLITTSELYNCYSKGSSGIFYLGYGTCPFCNKVIKYLNEVGQEMGVTIYYIDALNEDDLIIGDNTNIRRLTAFLEPILEKDDTGKKVLMTPHVFTIINGEFYGSYVSLPYKLNGDLDFDNPPTEKQINKVKKIYRNLFEPFVQ
ncbi:MAG: hypothetical protein Q4E33_00715 [Erysipelotrichaceae bacterium]|nr:hypothetical protein [Erysipelotrichaceae bacterium]